MKKPLIILSSVLVLIGLFVLVLTQVSDTNVVQASDSSCCSGVEAQMFADKQSDGCADTPAVMTAQDCPGIQAAAKASGCPAFTQEATTSFVASSEKASCCEGSEAAAMLAEACCGNCS